MRTTLTLEPDVAERLQRILREKNHSLKEIVNRALRKGLAEIEKEEPQKPYKVKPWPGGEFLPGIDIDKISQYLDDLDAAEFARKFLGK